MKQINNKGEISNILIVAIALIVIIAISIVSYVLLQNTLFSNPNVGLSLLIAFVTAIIIIAIAGIVIFVFRRRNESSI